MYKYDRGLYWFRQDLRFTDNPAFSEAVKSCKALCFVYLYDVSQSGEEALGACSRLWLEASLKDLKQRLNALGHDLYIVRSKNILNTLVKLVAEYKIEAVFWNRLYSPLQIQRDAQIKAKLKDNKIHVESTNSHLLWEPWEIKNQSGKPYQVYTAYWRASTKFRSHFEIFKKVSLNKTEAIGLPASEIADLKLISQKDWEASTLKDWKPGEESARTVAKKFIKEALSFYSEGRNRPDQNYCSKLAPYLHFGELSVRELWGWVWEAALSPEAKQVYLKELAWRDFAYYLLFHFPHTVRDPLREEFAKFPWVQDPALLKNWQRGQTGYPIVDAGMRQLWATGWMHNRVRMIVASFLIKDLFISWQEGAAWFWDTLFDADLASNTLGWQWTAGCGADAAPFFRIFNPVLQGEKFDPEGAYVREWVPELKKLKTKFIHKPWEATEKELTAAGVKLGVTYPNPIVDHGEQRLKALRAYKGLKGKVK